jgi:hypothetical protein
MGDPLLVTDDRHFSAPSRASRRLTVLMRKKPLMGADER